VFFYSTFMVDVVEGLKLQMWAKQSFCFFRPCGQTTECHTGTTLMVYIVPYPELVPQNVHGSITGR
jgi:hypothetical protein